MTKKAYNKIDINNSMLLIKSKKGTTDIRGRRTIFEIIKKNGVMVNEEYFFYSNFRSCLLLAFKLLLIINRN